MKTRTERGDIKWADDSMTFCEWVPSPQGKYTRLILKYSLIERIKRIFKKKNGAIFCNRNIKR